MKRIRVDQSGSFLAAAGAIGAAAILSRACPAKCGNCAQCAISAGSLAAGTFAIGGAIAISHRLKQHSDSGSG